MQGDQTTTRTDRTPGPGFRRNLRGISISSHVVAKWGGESVSPGRVVNVFRGCVNWVAADGELFCMVTGDAGNLPHGIVVDGKEDFRDLGLTTGIAVEADPSFIRFGTTGLSVDLSKARTWSADLAAGTVGPWSTACADAAVSVLEDRAPETGGARLLNRIDDLADDRAFPIQGGPIEQRLALAARDLCGAIRRQDTDAFVAAAECLVGTGIGLTPSGDDILLGALSVLTTWGDSAPFGGRFDRCVARLCAIVEGRTTRVSQAFLSHALGARFPELLADFLAAFAADDPRAVRNAAQRLKQFGKSSGREMALGALLANASLAAGHDAVGRAA